MNKVPLKDANQKFSSLIKQVDNEGIVSITRYGKEVYYMMTKDVYEGNNSFDSRMKSKARTGLWVEDPEGLLCQIYIDGEDLRVLKIDTSNGLEEVYWCSETRVSLKDITFEEGSPIKVVAADTAKVRLAEFYPVSGNFDKEEEQMNKHLEEALKQYREASPETLKAEFAGNKIFAA